MATEREPVRRTTQQRGLVLATVKASGVEHPSAEAVFARVRDMLPRISLGTVYRNLQCLAADGCISVVHLDGGAARYDPSAEPHDHFVCRTCGMIDDLPAAGSPAGRRAAELAGHEVTDHAVVLYGRCRRCRAPSEP
jgi:Fe2+ or Zn2+ uptake regulation protein